jgi:hypothetical protein
MPCCPLSSYFAAHVLLYYDALSNMGPVRNDLQRTTCLAVSATKGATWTRPSLGLVEFNGSRDNNIVWPLNNSAHSPGTVFWDPHGPPSARIKMVASAFSPSISPLDPYTLQLSCMPQTAYAASAATTVSSFLDGFALCLYACVHRLGSWHIRRKSRRAGYVGVQRRRVWRAFQPGGGSVPWLRQPGRRAVRPGARQVRRVPEG